MVVAPHTVQDIAKYNAMVEAMKAADGWPEDMPPVLVAGEHEALTGAHRIAAAKSLDIQPLELDVQDAVDELVETGLEWHHLLGMDDEELAAEFRAIGRDDLADLCN